MRRHLVKLDGYEKEEMAAIMKKFVIRQSAATNFRSIEFNLMFPDPLLGPRRH